MAFIRDFDVSIIDALRGEDKQLYDRLLEDVKNGEVFPAVRAGNLDFYYSGGLLFRLEKSGFSRNENYEKYN